MVVARFVALLRCKVTGIVLFFLFSSLILLRDVWMAPGSRLPADVGDPVLNVAILQWNATVTPLTDTWWNFPSFFPARGITAFTEHLLAPSAVAGPVIWLTGNPVLGYNVVFLLALAASGIAMWALVYWLTRSVLAGLVAGIAFAFSPYRGVHLSHVQMLWTFGMPLALLGAHWFLVSGRRVALALWAAGWLVTVLGNSYFVVFFGLYLAGWLAWFASSRHMLRRGLVLLGTLVVASVPLVPILLHYKAIHATNALTRMLIEIRSFSADMTSLWMTSPHALASLWVPSSTTEGALYPGLLVVVLSCWGGWLTVRQARTPGSLKPSVACLVVAMAFACAAVLAGILGPLRTDVLGVQVSLSNSHKPLSVALLFTCASILALPSMHAALRRRDAIVFYLGSVFVVFLLCLGPEPTFAGKPILYGTPYRWLMEIPALHGIRVPARFWTLGTLALAIAAGLATMQIRSRFSAFASSIVWLPALAVLLIEGWVTIPAVAAPAWSVPPPGARGSVVLELPSGGVAADAAAQLRAVAGGYATVNGYSGYYPAHYTILTRGLRDRDADVLRVLLARTPLYVSVDRRDRRRAAWLNENFAAQRVEHASSQRDLYLLPQVPSIARPAQERLPLIARHATCAEDDLAAMTDGDLRSRWQCGPQVETQAVIFALDEARSVAGVVLSIGRFSSDFPARLTVAVSEDTAVWRDVWAGKTASLALQGVLADPARGEIVVTFPSTRARYIRLVQDGRDDVYYWSVAEVEALADSQ